MKRGIVLALLVVAVCAGCKGSRPHPHETAKKDTTTVPLPTGPRPVADAVVGKNPRKLAFETAPLIGLTQDELRAIYGKAISKETDLGGRLLFPQAIETPDAPDKAQDLLVSYMIIHDKVETFDIFMHGTVRQQLVAALEKVRGQPSGSLESGGLLWNTTPPLRLRLESRGGTITPYLKLTVNSVSDQ